MSTEKDKKAVDTQLYKKPFLVSDLVVALVLGTYFLTVATIELSLSTYVIRENKPEILHDYLTFKGRAPIWKWWQLFTTAIVPLSIFGTVRDLLQTLTKRATNRRNLLDIVKAMQLFGILYTVLTQVMPLESKLVEKISMDNAQQLHFFHWIVFMLNVIGWLIPLCLYREGKTNEPVNFSKKEE